MQSATTRLTSADSLRTAICHTVAQDKARVQRDGHISLRHQESIETGGHPPIIPRVSIFMRTVTQGSRAHRNLPILG